MCNGNLERGNKSAPGRGNTAIVSGRSKFIAIDDM
jgi:hypothetical protein